VFKGPGSRSLRSFGQDDAELASLLEAPAGPTTKQHRAVVNGGL